MCFIFAADTSTNCHGGNLSSEHCHFVVLTLVYVIQSLVRQHSRLNLA